MKILLLQPPETLERVMGKGAHFVWPVPPYGLMYIGSFLEKNGYPVEIIDAYLKKYDVDQTVKEILARAPDVVGISCLTSNGANTFHVVKKLKSEQPDIKIVLGNVHAAFFSSFYISKAGADFVVQGDGEEPMLAIIKALDSKAHDFSTIPNISWKNGDTLVHNDTAKPTLELDELPLPGRHLIPFNEYTDAIYSKTPTRENDLVFSSRGCVFSCTFCCIANLKNYRYRDPIKVVDEVEYVVNKYALKGFTFGDPLFTMNKGRAIAISKELANRRIKTPWFAEGHASTIDLELLTAMKEGGCSEIGMGIETGTPELLKEIRKGTSHKKITNAIHLMKKVGIKATGLFMLGFPGETEENMMTTIQFATSSGLDRAQFAITTPYPGTDLYTQLIESGELRLRDEDDPEFVNDWFRYNGYHSYTNNEPIWSPKGITAKRMKQIQKLSLRKFYLRPRHFVAEVKKIRFHDLSYLKQFIGAAKDSFF
jgi:radical SAM superfamily enzyme YgiQ (UPF0313 family)